MFVIASKTRRAEITDDEQAAVSEFIKACWSGFCSTQPSGVMSDLGVGRDRCVLQESDPEEIVYYLRLLTDAVHAAKEWAVIGKRVDLMTGACSIIPVLVDALAGDSCTPIFFEF